jgi:hypothetical protein
VIGQVLELLGVAFLAFQAGGIFWGLLLLRLKPSLATEAEPVTPADSEYISAPQWRTARRWPALPAQPLPVVPVDATRGDAEVISTREF